MTEPTFTADEILGRVKNPDYTVVKTARILIAPQDLVDEHARLVDAHAAASHRDVSIDSGLHDIAQKLVTVEEQFERYYVPFKFRALSRKAWNDLLAEHPPTRAQIKEDQRTTFNVDTFPAAAIAACLIEPVMTVEQVQVLENGVDGSGGLTDAQFNVLFNTAAAVNTSGITAPKSQAAGALRRLNAASEKLATTTESLDPSS